MNNWKYSVFAILLYSAFVFSQIEEEDYLTNAYMSAEEYEGFKARVGEAVARHPEFKSAQQLLIAAYADTKISKSGLLPQVKFLIDSSGNWVGVADPTDSPDCEQIISWIEEKNN